MKVSRRELLLAAAATASAQAPPKPQAPESVNDALARQRASAQAVARVPLPMSTEPSFQFKA
jgi:hypothetical protein